MENLFFVGLLLVCILPALLGSGPVSYQHLRGTQLTSRWVVWRRLRRWRNERDTFVWGRFRVPMSRAKQHFVVAGTTRSGKTVFIRLLMQSVFPRIGQGESHRALVYDGKNELLGVIEGLRQPYQRVVWFDPFDSDGYRWDIAADVTDDASANQAATLLFPKHDSENQPFFSEAVQNLSANIMQVFLDVAPGQWRLSHLIYTMRSEERMKAVLGVTEKGRDTLAQFANTGETWGNITATISNRIREYEIFSALQDHARHSFSMKEWNETESILLLQKSANCPEVMDAVNRVLFTLGKRRLLSKPPSPRRRTWVIFDELASVKSKEMAKDLALLLEQGASRNIFCVIAFQNIAAVRDEFGQLGADRLIALCGNKALLRADDYASGEWAAGGIGKHDVRIKSVSKSTSGSSGNGPSSGTTTSYQDVPERWVVAPSEFMAIPPPDPVARQGIEGVFALPLSKATLFKDTVPAWWVFNGKTLAPESKRTVVERPSDQQRLQTTDADIERLLQGRVQLSSASEAPSAEDEEAGRTPSPAQTDPVWSPDANPATAPQVAAGSPPTADAVPATQPEPSELPGGVASSNAAPAPTTRPAAPLASASSAGKARKPAGKARKKKHEKPGVVPDSETSEPPKPFDATNEPQVWDLPSGTIQPASIWSVRRTP